MSELDIAIEKQIEYIVTREKRPFCIVDFTPHFTYDGKEYSLDPGTYRNKISELSKKMKIRLQYRTTHAYYSLFGYEFNRPDLITQDHVGLPLKVGRQTAIYKLLKDRHREKQSLHDFRIIFTAYGIWDIFSKIFPNLLNTNNKDVKLESWKFDENIEVIVTIHHTDTVSVAIACSSRPIAIDIPDLFYLVEILTRTEIRISDHCHGTDLTSIVIPRYTTWVIKMWHFGWDFHDVYEGEQFHVTIEEGLGDLWRIYTKRSAEGKVCRRAEHQESPNKPILEAVLDKIYSGDLPM